MRLALSTLVLLPLCAACEPEEIQASAQEPAVASLVGRSSGSATRGARTEVPAPLEFRGSAHAAAAELQLEAREPLVLTDLENVYQLSDEIYSGGEPLSKEALAELARLGIRTVLSVDGKAPDVEAAAALGMRYVHVPIRYRGIEDEELIGILKTFRELEAPFYVHCFHGKHRGPAAAAIGRMARDGVSRHQALAEMRQWSGTAEKYEGLYQVIAAADFPDADETEAIDWDFPSRHGVSDYRETMVQLTRARDALKLLDKNDWQPLEKHPDLDAVNEAQKLHQWVLAGNQLEGTKARPADFHAMKDDFQASSQRLLVAVQALQAGELERKAEASAAMTQLGALCSDCHKGYRNR